MQLEDLERRAGQAQQAALLARASGAKVDIPDPGTLREQFDAWLLQDDSDVDPMMMVKMRALGVSRGR